MATTAVFIAGVAGKAQTKVSPQEAAKEVIASCKKQYPDIHSETLMRCVVAESFGHKSCIAHVSTNNESDATKWVDNLDKCSRPIQDESINAMLMLRFDSMKPRAGTHLKLEDRKDVEALFFSDKKIVDFQNNNMPDPKLPKMPLTKKNADGLRREWCTGAFRKLGMPTQKVFDSCNRLFKKTTYALNFEIKEKRKAPVKPGQTKGLDPHEECLEARDYEGCIKVKTSGASRQTNDQCTKSGLCTVSTRGVDSYGFPKPMGWKYRQLDDGRIMYFDGPKRIPHNGEQARYIGYERITRYYQNPSAGTSGTYIGGTSASTNCTGYGSSVNCTTTGSSPTYIPGTSATPGGVRSAYFVNVFDCKDMTYASYKNSEVWIGWKSVKKKKPTGFSAALQNFCKKGDQYILKNMDVLNLEM